MAKKKYMKTSEARILIYLSQVENTLKNATNISRKLNMDYGYLIRILHTMKEKGWIKLTKLDNRKFYECTTRAPMKSAANELNPEQRKLR